MSSGLADLTSELGIDHKQFVDSLLQSANALQDFVGKAVNSMTTVEKAIEPVTQSIEKQTEVIQQQGRTWREFGAASAGNMKAVGDSAAKAALPVGGFLTLISRRIPGLRPLGLWLTLIGGAYRKLSSDAAEGEKSITKSSSGTAASMGIMAKAGDEVRNRVSPLLATLGTTAVASYLAYKVGIDEAVEASQKHLKSDSALMTASKGLLGSIGELTGAIVGQFTEGVKGSLMAVISWGTGFNSISEIVDYSAAKLTSWANSAKEGLDKATKAAYDAGNTFATALLIFHGADANQAQAFYEEGQALRELAAETERVIKLQEAQRFDYKELASLQGRAAEAARSAADVQRIGSLTSVEAIDAEIQALKLKGDELIRAGKWTDINAKGQGVASEAQKQIQSQINAAERQRQAIESGTATTPTNAAASQLAQAEAALYRLEYGENAAAVAAYRLTGATDEQVAKFKEVLAAQDAKKAADAEFDKMAREAAAAIDNENRLREQGTNRILEMKDQIDLLTGAATAGEVAMRQLTRQGFDKEQAEEIAALTDELERLKDEDKAGKKKTKEGDNTAVLKGTSAAAELILGGIGKTSQNKQEALLSQTLAVEKQMLAKLDRGLTFVIEEVRV